MDKFFEWNHPNESMYAMCLLCSEFNGKMRRMFASNLKWTNEKKQQHTNNWEKRLNSNLTKWLNARVAPIFALRLRTTAFLTFFCRCIRCIEFIFVLPCFRFVTQCTQQQFLCCWCFFFFIHSFRLFIRRSSESWEPNRKENVYLLLYRKQHHTPFGWICIVDRMPHQNA